MEFIKKMIEKHKSFIRYAIVGCGSVLIDFLLYNLFKTFMQVRLAKGLSYILGSVFSFTMNKIWSFESKKKTGPEAIKFAIVYSITFVINNIINSAVLNFTGVALIGFLVATGVSIILNFLGQRLWIFKK